MKKYGLYDTNTNSLISQMPVDYIELPNIVSSGGNVYLNINDGKKVTGNGLIQAKGAPEIKVNNNSTLYMIVNDLSIVEPGGEIVLNNFINTIASNSANNRSGESLNSEIHR